MKPILVLFTLYVLFELGLVVFGVGIGLLLHRILPSIDLATGALIGVVSTGFSFHYFIRLMTFLEHYDLAEDRGDDPPPIWVYPAGSTRSERKRRRK